MGPRPHLLAHPQRPGNRLARQRPWPRHPDPALVGDWTFDCPRDGAYPNLISSGLSAKVVEQVEQMDDPLGKYIRFTGKGYLEVPPDPRLNQSKACTVETWVRPADPKRDGCILNKQIVWSWGYALESQGTYVVADGLRTQTGPGPLRAKAPFSPEAWTHVVAVFAPNGALRLYANGTLIAEHKAQPMVVR